MKPTINETVVVEGKTDTAKLKEIFNVNTIETNGSALNEEILNLIKKVNAETGVILLLDPDGQGEKIRNKIMSVVDNCKNIFLKKSDIDKQKNKFGVAEAYKKSLIEAFDNIVVFDCKELSITWNDFISLELNTKSKREIVTNNLKISKCNHKQLYKRLNMMNISYDELKRILNV